MVLGQGPEGFFSSELCGDQVHKSMMGLGIIGFRAYRAYRV